MANTSGSLQPSAILPGEGVAAAVVIGQGVADLVISKVYTTVNGQQVAPTVSIAIGVSAVQRRRVNTSSRQCIGLLREDVSRIIVGINIGAVQGGIVLPNQLADVIIHITILRPGGQGDLRDVAVGIALIQLGRWQQ